MKKIVYFFSGIIAIIIAGACNEGIDPISSVEPGSDQTAPAVTITYPEEGTKIEVVDEIATINIQFEAVDDIELQSVSIVFDDTEIQNYTQFKDYRRLLAEYVYEYATKGDHVLTITATDLSGKSTSQSVNFQVGSGSGQDYTPKYDGEIFYMPFDGENKEMVSKTDPTVIGTPGFAGEGKQGGDAYAGATDSYLEFPTTSLTNSEFSAVFWMKINAAPERAGILIMSPPDEANPTAQNNRLNGFRFFREKVGEKQRFKLNAGNGTAETWFDGGSKADIDPNVSEWVHFAFTISSSECVFYINGQIASQGTFTGIDWTGCDVLTIMSGVPRFTGWEHFSDLSYLDELRIFNKALTQTEIQTIIDAENVK